ncbi:MAG TPA: shikimate kinase [Candidatus Binatia bacterium]|nr:shikimate kinase [Candidatus Binatia bacterium]
MGGTGPRAPRRAALVCLAGFMGSGKTTVGRLLAGHLGCRFVDLDERIEEYAGATIREIFENSGEPGFRDLEFEVLGRVLGEISESGGSAVVALGGGTWTFAQTRNRILLQQAGAALVWLDCPVEELARRCATMTNRPLFRDESSLRDLYHQRLPSYRTAEYRVEGTGEPREVVSRILELGCFEGVRR